jgi:hypothetical protein
MTACVFTVAASLAVAAACVVSTPAIAVGRSQSAASSASHAATGFVSCRLKHQPEGGGVYNLQARGVPCVTAASALNLTHIHVVHHFSKHKWSWTTAGWSCLTVTFFFAGGLDDQGAISDCRRGPGEMRWSSSTKIQPRSLF